MRSDDGVPGSTTGKRHVVALARSRRHAVAHVSTPDSCEQPAALALLTLDERTALNLTASNGPALPTGSVLLAAASGLAKLAAAHLAQSLAADGDTRELTRKDRLALAFAPRFSADVHLTAPTDARMQGSPDPIVALLEGSQDAEPGDLIITARLGLGPRDGDLTDDC